MSSGGTLYKESLLRWVRDEAARNSEPFLQSNWTLQTMECPQQNNSYDCGMFTIACAQTITDNIPVTSAAYNQQQMSARRITVANDILRGDLTHDL
jgi:Ulp1 family protease